MEKLTIEELIDLLATTNDSNYNILKCVEELTELSEVLLKYVNKSGENQPSKELIAEELSHVILRSTILAEELDIVDLTGTKFDEKVSDLEQLYLKDKHTGRI